MGLYQKLKDLKAALRIIDDPALIKCVDEMLEKLIELDALLGQRELGLDADLTDNERAERDAALRGFGV